MVKVKLVGATGYGGVGLIELIHRHPEMELAVLIANRETGRPVSDVWPHLKGFCDQVVYNADDKEANVEADVVVFSTPDGVGQREAPAYIEKGIKVLDYSGDFRFNTTDLYREYATRIGKDPEHKSPMLLEASVYGLTELHREEIKNANIVGNPGCFAISCIMGLAPAAKNHLVELDGVYCDCKTGVSGAGKKPNQKFHYPEQYDTSYAYKLSGHQHVMEIERELSAISGKVWNITFTPQVVPMTRGIISTIYGRLEKGMNQDKVEAAYREFYKGSYFVRVLGLKDSTSTGDVRGSNFINIQVACDERTGTFRIISHIDNLMKGQAGSAVQNLNVMFGLEESTGLSFPGAHP